MQTVDVTYYLDVLSSWCFIGDRALVKIEAKYGDRVRVDWRIAQLFKGGPVPYDRERCGWFYARTNRISGVQLNPNWLDSPEATTSYANLAAEAARALGAGGSDLRRALAKAALVDGKPLGHRQAAIDEAARISGLSREALDRGMRDSAVAARIFCTTNEFEKLQLPQRPAFVIRNASGDLAMLSGLYTFESLDAVIGEMLRAAEITEEIGVEPARPEPACPEPDEG